MKKIISLCITLLFFSLLSSAQCWQQISTGNNFTMAIKSNNTLWGWGANHQGNLGDTTHTGRLSPTLISPDTNWAIVSCGTFMTLAMKLDGSIWSWGNNNHSALGIGNDSHPNFPTQIGTDFDWIQIDAGSYHSVARKSDSTIWGWGHNTFDQLGNDNSVFNSDVPIQLDSASNWKTVQAGNRGTTAINSNNQLWGCGSRANLVNLSGTVTDFRLRNSDSNWIHISPSPSSYVHGIKDNGKLFTAGLNIYGQLGIDSISNYHALTQVGSDSNWLSIHSGINHCLAIKQDSTLWSWGKNDKGELGDSSNISKYHPIQIGTDSDWISASARNQFSLGLKADGTLWSWGLNSSGQLGLGNNINCNYPKQVTCAFQSYLDIDEEVNKTSVYPNPTSDKIKISLNNTYNKIELKVYNSLGQLSQKKKYFERQEIVISINGVPGIYFLELISNSKVIDHIMITKQ